MASTCSSGRHGRRETDEPPVPVAEGDPFPPEDRLALASSQTVEGLYRAYQPRLTRFLRRSVERSEAGDLVQQVFLRLCGLGKERQAAIGNPASYLWRSAANIAADRAKTDRRRAAALHMPLDDIELAGPDQIAALEARDMLQRLEVAMQRLKPRTREIFLAHRIDGYSYIEIAEITGLSVKGVEKHMSRAIAFVDRVFSAR